MKERQKRYLVVALDETGKAVRFRAFRHEVEDFTCGKEQYFEGIDRRVALQLLFQRNRLEHYRESDIRDALLEVEYVECDKPHSHLRLFHFIDGTVISKKVTLNEAIRLMNQYADCFVRIQGSCIVNRNFLDIEKCNEQVAVTLSGSRFFIGKLYQSSFLSFLENAASGIQTKE